MHNAQCTTHMQSVTMHGHSTAAAVETAAALRVWTCERMGSERDNNRQFMKVMNFVESLIEEGPVHEPMPVVLCHGVVHHPRDRPQREVRRVGPRQVIRRRVEPQSRQTVRAQLHHCTAKRGGDRQIREHLTDRTNDATAQHISTAQQHMQSISQSHTLCAV
jgi:hypothetical protein